MKPSVRKAIQIASLPQRDFDSTMGSGLFTRQQVRDAHALRGALMAKRGRSLGSRLSDPAFEPMTFSKRDDHHEEEPKMLTSIEKSQRVAQWRKALDRDATEIAEREGISKAAAIDRIVSNQHRLEQIDKAHVLSKLGGGSLPQDRPGTMRTQFNPPGDESEVISADGLLRRRAAALKEKDPGLTAAQATLRASQDPEFVKALNAERERKMMAASRIYG